MQISLLLVYLGVAAADALATWLPNFSRLGQHVSAAYRRRAPGPPGIVIAIPGYLLSGSSGHIPSQHHGLAFEIFFISVVIGICGAVHSIPAALLLCQLGLISACVHVLMPFLLHGDLLTLVRLIRTGFSKVPGGLIARFLLFA